MCQWSRENRTPPGTLIARTGRRPGPSSREQDAARDLHHQLDDGLVLDPKRDQRRLVVVQLLVGEDEAQSFPIPSRVTRCGRV
ncbi:hypothetical protein NHX12_014088 [Muraenolepis orangiensis]|uniref:Uncharacterized protein n=1 Tax=Muraenolepis orangiensis TaxID=630683 RepID=A0A9Q0DBV8_9TELE|nr:hypothetical protein NHX12_014088 [Muraenolepis orangiensis]